MPSGSTLTAWNTFVAATKARASEVNANFNAFRGHLLPIDPTLSALDLTASYGFGSATHAWNNLFLRSPSATTTGYVQIRADTLTTSPLILTLPYVTPGANRYMIGTGRNTADADPLNLGFWSIQRSSSDIQNYGLSATVGSSALT